MSWTQNGKKLKGIKSYTIQEYQGSNIATFNFSVDSESYIIIAGTGEYPPYLMVFSTQNFTINFPWGTYSPIGTTPYEGVDYYYYSVVAYCSRDNDFFINDNTTIITRPDYTSLLEYVTSHYVEDTPTFDLDVYTLGATDTLVSMVWSNLQNAVEGVNYRILVECSPTSAGNRDKLAETEWYNTSMQFNYMELRNCIENYPSVLEDERVIVFVSLFSYSTTTVERIIYDTKAFRVTPEGSLLSYEGDVETHEQKSITEDDNYNEDTSVFINPHRPQDTSLDNLMTTSYKITESKLRALATKLWDGTFAEGLEALQNNPLENIVSIKTLPFDLTTSGSKSIFIGNIDMEISGDVISDNHTYTLSSVTVPKKVVIKKGKNVYPDFLNYEPYTGVSIYLPFIGVRDLPTNVVMGNTLKVVYYYDIPTATCAAEISVNDTVINYYNGNCGIDLPISAQNRAQVELAQRVYESKGNTSFVKGVTNFISSLANKNAAGVVNTGSNFYQEQLNSYVEYASAQYHTTTKGSIGSQLINLIPNECYLIIERANYTEPETYAHDFGYPCELSATLGNLHGYTQVSHSVELNGIPCTSEEREVIRELLIGGVYL